MRRRTVKVQGGAVNEKYPTGEVAPRRFADVELKRRARTSVRRIVALLGIAGGLGACAREDGRLLRAAERISLGIPAAETMTIDSTGRFWIGAPGEIWIRDSTATPRRIPAPGEGAPRVVGWSAAGAYLRVGDSLFLLSAVDDTVTARRGDFGRNPLAFDVRGRAIYQGARSGAVLAHDPVSLEPIWAWASLDAPTTAIALSPEGDRLYQALGADEDGARVLTRDLQTGRVLGRTELRHPLRELAVARSGVLYGLAVDGRRAIVLALQPQGHELTPRWRLGLPASEGYGEVTIAVAGGRILVQGLGSEAGMRVLSGESGARLGRTRGPPLDAAFGPDGALWTLYPGELRRLE